MLSSISSYINELINKATEASAYPRGKPSDEKSAPETTTQPPCVCDLAETIGTDTEAMPPTTTDPCTDTAGAAVSVTLTEPCTVTAGAAVSVRPKEPCTGTAGTGAVTAATKPVSTPPGARVYEEGVDRLGCGSF